MVAASPPPATAVLPVPCRHHRRDHGPGGSESRESAFRHHHAALLPERTGGTARRDGHRAAQHLVARGQSAASCRWPATIPKSEFNLTRFNPVPGDDDAAHRAHARRHSARAGSEARRWLACGHLPARHHRRSRHAGVDRRRRRRRRFRHRRHRSAAARHHAERSVVCAVAHQPGVRPALPAPFRVGEPTFNVDYVNNTTTAPGPDGVADSSGQHFINLASTADRA